MNSGAETQKLWSNMSATAREEIDVFETELNRFLDGTMPEKLFLEFRLRHGVYGQRQANIQMLRIKIPMGCMTADQLEVLANVAEEYGDRIIHITTRQDVQIHFVEIRDTPEVLRRLAHVGITTKEACGNVVRNVTCCPTAGVCGTEAFDVTPHARAMAIFLLRHPDAQNFGRKFKVSYSGCRDEACALALIHDIGAVAATRSIDGQTEEGFEVYVGGGLGAVPHQAKLLSEFLKAEEMLPMAQAISRVFARLGEKKQRARARMKFLVANLGIEEFRKLIFEEMGKLPKDSQRDQIYETYLATAEKPLKKPSKLDLGSGGGDDDSGDGGRASGNPGPGFRLWYRNNVTAQRQEGYSVATVYLPLGDLTSAQLRGLAQVSRKYIKDSARSTVPQNIVLRWVSDEDLPALYEDLRKLELALPMAHTMADMTACPGTDTCKLGIASSRGLAAVFQEKMEKDLQAELQGGGDGTRTLRKDIVVKMSGCFNSCAQHHIANIGFFGTSKRKGGRVIPLFQVILGGEEQGNANTFGLPVAKVPSRNVPEVVDRLGEIFDSEKQEKEDFNATMARLGKKEISDRLADLAEIGDGDEFAHDNRQPWEYIKEVGKGECAGEMVEQAEFFLDDAERVIFESSLLLEKENYQGAANAAAQAMKNAADALLSTNGLLISDNYDTPEKFKEFYVKPRNFHIGVAEYYGKALSENLATLSPERARQRVEEANLFVEEAHIVYSRMAGSQTK